MFAYFWIALIALKNFLAFATKDSQVEDFALFFSICFWFAFALTGLPWERKLTCSKG